ncbi:glycoside hydrolase family 88/105 protein [Paenibacillus turpanensis]|uniref:glycoside hydrolase family 88/105 protein n=1 Tax=Paenibacillus turpanensis TaxID=2689078 RepID=UPI001407FB3F|nr:glycoside hydrolase family 88 protein [Paenibacillus turpanensis]
MNSQKWFAMAETIMSASDSKGYHPEITERWAYVPGMMLLALLRVWEMTKDTKYYDYVKKHMDLFIESDGAIRTYELEEYNLDQINQGKVLFHLFKQTGEERYSKAAHLLADQLEGHPRTTEGGFWHKKVYPFQMWLDGLYMSSPFLAEYAKIFNRPELFDEVAHQILTVEQRTRDKKTGLLYHGWDESKEEEWCNPATGTSFHFWSRAMGWYAMAIVDSLEHFPKNHRKRGTIAGIFLRMVRALESVQDAESGLWYQVLDQGKREGNYLEASGSCMFVYAIAKGVRLGYLPRNYRKLAVRGYEGLLAHLVTHDESGVHLHQICKGAGLGNRPYRDGSYTYYINERIVSDQFIGQAPFILAGVEMERLESVPEGNVGDSGNNQLVF